MTISTKKKELRDKRKAAGLCLYCAQPATRASQCAACWQRGAESRKRYYERRKAANKCITPGCLNLATNGVQRCAGCSAKLQANENARAATGVCLKCAKPAEVGKFCKEHSEKRAKYTKGYLADRKRQRLAAGHCIFCDVPNDTGKTYCDDCTARRSKEQARRKLDLFNHYGGAVCEGCGETELCVLQLDHKNGDGAEHRKLVKQADMYRWVKKNNYPPMFRVLCANCNIRFLRGAPFPNDSGKPNG